MKEKNRQFPVTTRQLAEELGLSHSAVAAALRGDRRTSAETRRMVLQHARERGYVRNPAATALAAQRRHSPHHVYNIGLITAGRLAPPQHPLYVRCRSSAAALGYGFEYLHLSEFRSFSALHSVLEARGVGGVLIDTLAEGIGRMALEQLEIPMVKLHDGLPQVPADMVSFDQYRQTRQAFRMAWERGHRRIGITLPRTPRIRSSNRVRLSALLGIQAHFGLPLEPDLLRECAHPFTTRAKQQMIDWVKAMRIDCLICHAAFMLPLFQKEGWKVPHDLGVIGLYISPEEANLYEPRLAGFTQIPDRLADAATRTLDSLIRQPSEAQGTAHTVLLVQPEWLDGESF